MFMWPECIASQKPLAMSVADVIEQLNARLSDSGDESTQEPDPMPCSENPFTVTKMNLLLWLLFELPKG